MINHGFDLVAVFDEHPADASDNTAGLPVLPVSSAVEHIQRLRADIAVIGSCAQDPQAVADILVAGGIESILNLSPSTVTVPSGIDIRSVDVVAELFALAYRTDVEPLKA
jgi:redox-sensing transcriptional repressor